jgi:hypothetical protein
MGMGMGMYDVGGVGVGGGVFRKTCVFAFM